MAMKVNELVRSMDLNFAIGKTMKVEGASGIGKSEISWQYAVEQRKKHGRYGYFILNAQTANLSNTIGFMIPQDREWNGVKYKGGTYTYPEYFDEVTLGDPAMSYDHGLMVIEEWGQASGDVKRALATLVHGRKIGRHVLNPGISILVLSNRPEDRSGVTKEYDFLINRWNQQTLVSALDPLIEHYLDVGASEVTMAFAAENSDTVIHTKAPKDQGPWCTPRSLLSADRFLANAMAAGIQITDPILTQNFEGIIGVGATSQYMSFVRLRHTLPKLVDIVKDPLGTFVPDANDARMLTIYTLATNVRKEWLDAIIKYVNRFPQSFATAFIKAMLKKEPLMMHTKEVGAWMRGNVALLAAIQAV